MNDDYELFKQQMGALSGAIFLFGLALLFGLHALWPGILVVIWLAAGPALFAEKGWRYGLWLEAQITLYALGLPLLLAWDALFPGVLVLAGMSALLIALAPPDRLETAHKKWLYEQRAHAKRKRKRGSALPPVEERLAEVLGYRLEDDGEVDDWESGDALHDRLADDDGDDVRSSTQTGEPPRTTGSTR